MSALISVRALSMSRGARQLFTELSFALHESERLGLIGPNGAGKTTLLKALCGLVLPESGVIEIKGVPAGSAALPRVLGLVHGEERSFYWRLTARENLNFYARLHGLSRGRREGVVAELLERVDLSKDADRRFGDFSSGMRQRLAIARALLADPPVLLMDEPTRSLDPLSASRLRSWIKDELHGRLGKTVLVATHNLQEAEQLCHRVAILARGVLRAADTPEALRRHGLGGVHYRLRVRGALPEDGPEPQGRRDVDGVTELQLAFEGEEGLASWLAALHHGGGAVLECAPETPELEEVFERLVLEDEERAAAAAEEGR